MKEDNRQAAASRASAGHFKQVWTITVICLLVAAGQMQGQCIKNAEVFVGGEQTTYDIYFKWGLLMPKAGTASMSIQETNYQGTPAWHNRVLVNTSGMINKVFGIRDTMQNYITKENTRLLYSGKRTLEGGYYEMDDLTYTYKDKKTYIHAIRKTIDRVKTDTVLVGGECVLDLLGSLMYARSFEWDKLDTGVQYPLQVGMGKSLITVTYRYEGQRIVEHDNAKFRTRLFVIDIYDGAFSESKAAMEIWIGDDDNHLPVKMRAKLKIGAMEAYYKSAGNLRYPLTCRITMPK
jgi:hypothetical protein